MDSEGDDKLWLTFSRGEADPELMPIYYDNDAIDGFIHCKLREPVSDSDQELAVSLVCRVVDDSFTLGEELFSTRQVVFHGGTLEVGTHKFAFSFHVPFNKLPPSLIFENQARIQWAVVGHYYQGSCVEVTACLREVQKQTLFFGSPELRPISHYTKKLFRGGTIAIKAELDKAVYITGEDIKIKIQIQTSFANQVKSVDLCAKQNKVLVGKGKLSCIYNKEGASVVLDAARAKISSSTNTKSTWEKSVVLKPNVDLPNEHKRFTRSRKQMVVKSEQSIGLCPTTLYFCHDECGDEILSVQVTYEVELKVKLNGMNKNLMMRLPCIISDDIFANTGLSDTVNTTDREGAERVLYFYHLKPPQNKPPTYERLNQESVESEASSSSHMELTTHARDSKPSQHRVKYIQDDSFR
eukprot:CFRG2093T1